MGVGVSDWRLAQSVSRLGQLGVVSGTALDGVLARRLQDGDPDGVVRRALKQFPFPRMAKRALDKFFIPGGKAMDVPYRNYPMHNFDGSPEPQELCMLGNFVEVFLAREGHENPVGINYLEKIQLPHLASMYGALLAGVAVVIMGAGIPLAIPDVLTALTAHESAEYPITVIGQDGKAEICNQTFNPSDFFEEGFEPKPLRRPDFLPIVSSELLAKILLKKTGGRIDGFIVEGSTAGGHNAPPRGRGGLSESGEPVYGLRDTVNLAAIRKLGLPFWLAGSVGSAEGLKTALAEGACGVQVGTAFALCEESGLVDDMRHELVRQALAGEARVFTDPKASPTGFPFKVAVMEGSLSDADVYARRRRGCDVGMLRQPYRREDGKIGFRCPAEPVAAYVAKGGKVEDTVGCVCLCNALSSDVGRPQCLADGSTEEGLVTLGDDYLNIGQFCTNGQLDYSAEDVIRMILNG